MLDAALATLQFFTRIPVPQPQWSEDLLGRGALFLPLVGLVIGGSAALLDWTFRRYTVGDPLRAIAVLTFLVVITGGLHEDGLADVADGFGGGSSREKTLAIMADSRIGSFGVIALTLSLLARYALIAALPTSRAAATLVAAHVLCRWTSLPLAAYLAPARGNQGQGVRFGMHLPRHSAWAGLAVAAAIVAGFLGRRAAMPVAASIVVALITALYYRRRISGVTGDCLGATNQLTEIAIYACGLVKF